MVIQDLDKTFRDILSMRLDVKENVSDVELDRKYAELKENAPTLFDMVKSNSEDYLPMLTMMFHKAKKVKKGDLDKDETDKEFGEMLAKKYIYPKIDREKEEEHGYSAAMDRIYETEKNKKN